MDNIGQFRVPTLRRCEIMQPATSYNPTQPDCLDRVQIRDDRIIKTNPIRSDPVGSKETWNFGFGLNTRGFGTIHFTLNINLTETRTMDRFQSATRKYI